MGVWDIYYDWLMDICGLRNFGYRKLTYQLHNSPFVYFLREDGDRKGDGLYLRKRFETETGFQLSEENHPCGVLEVLIALAIRIDDEYIGSPSELHPEVPFMEMLDNLALLPFKDYCYNYNCDLVICRVLSWMHRDFEYNGVGSIFPLRHPGKDQREIPIWSQMMAYISENYG